MRVHSLNNRAKRMKKNLRWLFLALLWPAGALAGEEILVAVAANVEYAMPELKEVFETQTGIEVKTVVNSSGKLTAQIRSGAPFDLFLSADMKYPDSLFASGHADSLPRVYAYGAIVLWTLQEVELSKGMEILASASIRRIAIANPQTAPYGEAALQALNYYQIYEQVKTKLVYGRNVAQATQYIVTGAAEAGFTAKSVALSPQMAGKGKWIEIDPAAYAPIAQGMVILKHGAEEHPRAVRTFYDFMLGEAAGKILQTYGYRLP